MNDSSPSGNYFKALNAVNVSDHVEKKAGFSYLSWPYAVAQLRLAEPTATWEVRRFDGLPYLVTDLGVFVEVAVTVQGVCLSQIHPVLDGRNRPLLVPTAFDINSSIQRCLVKSIALHGLGLYIYAGEDLPQPVSDAANDESANVRTSPTKQTEVRQPSLRPEPTISKAQVAHIHKLVVETGTNLRHLLDYFGAPDLPAIKAVDFPRVVRALEKRRAA